MRPCAGRGQARQRMHDAALARTRRPEQRGDAAGGGGERHIQREVALRMPDRDFRAHRPAFSVARRMIAWAPQQEQKRQQNGKRREPRRFRFAARRLQRGVDRQRQGPGLAGNIGDEGDDGAEFSQRAGKGGDGAGDQARAAPAAG